MRAGELIRKALDAKGMTQVELAQQCQLTTKHVSQVVTGRALLSYQVAALIEREIGLDAGVLMAVEMGRQLAAARAAVRNG